MVRCQTYYQRSKEVNISFKCLFENLSLCIGMSASNALFVIKKTQNSREHMHCFGEVLCFAVLGVRTCVNASYFAYGTKDFYRFLPPRKHPWLRKYGYGLTVCRPLAVIQEVCEITQLGLIAERPQCRQHNLTTCTDPWVFYQECLD